MSNYAVDVKPHGLPFADKTIWITGASSGIGAALVTALVRQKAKLILSSRNLEKLSSIKSAFPDAHIIVQPLDLEDPASIHDAVDNVLSSINQVDYLFHNGGISQRSLTQETSIEVDRRLMEVNYFGAVILTKRLLPLFLERGQGHFVVTSSIVGKFGFPLRSAYSASKHALHGYFESLRAEHQKHGIEVTIVCPGRIRTDISLNALNKDGVAMRRMDDGQIHGMPAHICAEKILRAVRKNKKEVYIGRMEILMIYFKRFLPFLYYKLVSKVKPT